MKKVLPMKKQKKVPLGVDDGVDKSLSPNVRLCVCGCKCVDVWARVLSKIESGCE